MTISRRVDPVVLASRDERIAGNLPIQSLTRLSSLLQTSDGNVQVRIAFDAGENDHPLISGDIKAKVAVSCQRCLQTMQLDVETEFRVTALDSDSEDGEGHGLFDAVLRENGEIDLYVLIEDELLMAMPMAPMHESGEACTATGRQSEQPDVAEHGSAESQKPFKDLDKLMAD